MRIWTGMPNGDDQLYEVWLDGVKVDGAFEADDQLGKVWLYAPILKPSDLGYEIKSGKVEFRKPIPVIVPHTTAVQENKPITLVGAMAGGKFVLQQPVIIKRGDKLTLELTYDLELTVTEIQLLKG